MFKTSVYIVCLSGFAGVSNQREHGVHVCQNDENLASSLSLKMAG